MGTEIKLRKIELELKQDLIKTTLPFSVLGEKYGVTRQAIFNFCQRRGIKRPKREHTLRKCQICRALMSLAKRTHGDFTASGTITNRLGVSPKIWRYHLRRLRKEGLISPRFGRMVSKKVERAYRLYLTKKLPVSAIGKEAGLRNFYCMIRDYRASGWNVPQPLFRYDRTERRKARLRLKKKRK